MYLGYQNGKIKFYTEQPLQAEFYNLDKVEETDLEYILDGEEYVLNDEAYQEKQAQKERERINSLTLDSITFYKEILRTSSNTRKDIQNLIQSTNTFSDYQKESLLIDLQNSLSLVRGSYFVNTIGILLDYTKEDLDYLFENKIFSY